MTQSGASATCHHCWDKGYVWEGTGVYDPTGTWEQHVKIPCNCAASHVWFAAQSAPQENS